MRMVHKCPFPEGWLAAAQQAEADSAGSGVVPRPCPALGGTQGLTEEEVQVLVVVGQVSALLPAVLWRQAAAGGAALRGTLLPGRGRGLAGATGQRQL